MDLTDLDNVAVFLLHMTVVLLERVVWGLVMGG